MTVLQPLGDQAFLARLPDEDAAARWASTLRAQTWTGVVDVVLAYQTVAVHADPEQVDLDELARRLERLEPGPDVPSCGRPVVIPVLYDGADLAEVTDRLGLSTRAVIELHSGQDYRVFALGFRPGFPYAGYLPEALCGLARRASPRTRVPAGSVAMVGRQTAIYPCESPGGWHLIGTTPLRIVDLEHGAFPIRAGDRLRFVPINRDEFEARHGELLGPCSSHQ